MSEGADTERTLEPTSKKLDEARQRGNVPRSAEWSMAAVVGVGIASLWFGGSALLESLTTTMRSGLQIAPMDWMKTDAMQVTLVRSSVASLVAILPVLTSVLLAAVTAPALIGGWNFSLQALRFDAARLDPLSGLERLWSGRSVLELAKSLLKVTLVGGCAALIVRHQADRFSALAMQDLMTALPQACRLMGTALIVMTGALLCIAMIDAPWQMWSWRRNLRMSFDELRQEFRESDGSPETRGRVREAQRALARGRMMEDVPQASVVVTNPTHYAVALRYDANQDGAPVVVAKGVDAVAATIRGLAEQHGIPLVPVPPLARVLYKRVDIGAPIPPRLYTAVAQVLTYVWHVELRRRKGNAGRSPEVPVFGAEIESWPTK